MLSNTRLDPFRRLSFKITFLGEPLEGIRWQSSTKSVLTGAPSFIFPIAFSIVSSKWLLDFSLADSRILYIWQVLKFIQKFIIELHVLQCLGGLIKNNRVAGLFQISQKERFFIAYYNQVLFEITSQCGPLPPKKALPLPFTLAKKKTYPNWHSIERRHFFSKNSRVFPIPTDRVGIAWWTLS